MTVKELHELATAQVERYIDRKTQTRFTIDYSENIDEVEFSKAFAMYKENADKKIVCVWAMVNHDGNPVLVAEFQ